MRIIVSRRIPNSHHGLIKAHIIYNWLQAASASGGTKCPFFMQAALSSVGEWVMFQDIRVHNEACLLKMETAATTETATASASSLLKLKKGKPLSKIASRIAGPASREGRIIVSRQSVPV